MYWLSFLFLYLMSNNLSMILNVKAVLVKEPSSSSSSSSCRATSTDIPDLLSPLFPIVHRLWQVFRATFLILT